MFFYIKKASKLTLHHNNYGKKILVKLLRQNLKSGGFYFFKCCLPLRNIGWTSGVLEITETSSEKH